METVSEPDIQIDLCPKCGGRFLDKGELDALATGMVGEIEYCSIDTDPHEDTFATRVCPKCPDQDMQKVNLLLFSELIFDYCPSCNGFFLDKGETARMNVELAELSGASSGEEFRGTIDDHLVRINQLRDVFVYESHLGGFRSQSVEYFQVVAYLRDPLNVGLRISKEPWHAKLTKLFGLFKRDIKIGDEAFDAAFIVQGENERQVRNLLSPELRAALLDFNARKPRLFSESVLSGLTSKSVRGSLTVWDNRIEYREGPYAMSKAKPNTDATVRDLLDLAALLERDPT